MDTFSTSQKNVTGTRTSAYDHPKSSVYSGYSISITPEADIYVGNSGVTTSNGVLVKGGTTKSYSDVSPYVTFYLVSSGSTVKTYIEVFA